MEEPASTSRRGSSLRSLREWVLVVIIAVVVATVLRTYVVQQFYIAGPSMETTLFGDDRVLVNKLAYRLGDPERGDVVVFDRITMNGDTIQHDDLIKRVIGLPGETIELRDCVVFVNGSALVEPWLDRALTDKTIDATTRCGTPDVSPTTVGDDQMYLVGDNRPLSFDSRMFGPVDASVIVGKAVVVIWPPQDMQRL